MAVDDATGAIQEMRFVPSESTFAYFEMLAGYLRSHGKPVAFYSDKHSVFRVAKADAKSGHQTTQFGRALLELNIEILCANSSQAPIFERRGGGSNARTGRFRIAWSRRCGWTA